MRAEADALLRDAPPTDLDALEHAAIIVAQALKASVKIEVDLDNAESVEMGVSPAVQRRIFEEAIETAIECDDPPETVDRYRQALKDLGPRISVVGRRERTIWSAPDAVRLDWLEADISRLEDVRGRCNNEGVTIREAIDWLRSQVKL